MYNRLLYIWKENLLVVVLIIWQKNWRRRAATKKKKEHDDNNIYWRRSRRRKYITYMAEEKKEILIFIPCIIFLIYINNITQLLFYIPLRSLAIRAYNFFFIITWKINFIYLFKFLVLLLLFLPSIHTSLLFVIFVA